MRIAILVVVTQLIITVYADELDQSSELGYQGFNTEGDSVESTLAKLKNDPEVNIRVSEGWAIATKEGGRIIWSFTPINHPANPSFVKREIVERDGSIYIDTSASCSSTKEICDKLVQDFVDLNNRIVENINRQNN